MFRKKVESSVEYTSVCQADLVPEANGMPLWATMKQPPRDFADVKSCLYDAAHLGDLLSQVDVCQVADGVLNEMPAKLKAVRFIVNADNELVFGREGYPGMNIPMHCEMDDEGECVTAGNMFFDANDKLVKISNQSGDFRPEFETLQFAVLLLCKQGMVPEAGKLVIDKIDKRGVFESRYTTTLSKIMEHDFFKHQLTNTIQNK